MEAIILSKPKTALEVRAEHLTTSFLSQGFLYLKLELEAQVDPDYDKESECGSCEGSGRVACESCDGTERIETDCSTCHGKGFLSDNETTQSDPCQNCTDGVIESDCEDCTKGSVPCNDCDGRGYFQNDDWLNRYHEDFLYRFKDLLGNINDFLKYISIYKDGSVDIEVTLTLRVNYINQLPSIIRAFTQTCREFGGCCTQNAGLHLTLLPGYRYPRTEKLDEKKLAHFKKEVSKLLLGLICLGCPGEKTRAFEYRDLEISSQTKYSAIYTHNDTCLEYRLFDTCFDSPLTILIYLELINQTLSYYTDKPRRILKLKASLPLEETNKILNKSYNGHYRKLAEVFKTDESIKRLFTELPYLVSASSKKWLCETYKAYTKGRLTKQQLFSQLVKEVKG